MKKEMSWRIFLAPYSSCSDDLRLEDFLCHSKYGRLSQAYMRREKWQNLSRGISPPSPVI